MDIKVTLPDDADVSAVDNLKANEMEKLNAVCFWLIKQCVDTNAKSMNIEQTSVTHFGKELGDWKITVSKIKDK